MKYKTLFRVLLKAVGVLVFANGMSSLLINATSYLVYFVSWLAPGSSSSWSFGPRAPNWGWPSLAVYCGPVFQVAFGMYLFFGGKWLIDRAIPGNRPYCPECGYDLTGTSRYRCPECNTPFRPEDVRPPEILEPPDRSGGPS